MAAFNTDPRARAQWRASVANQQKPAWYNNIANILPVSKLSENRVPTELGLGHSSPNNIEFFSQWDLGGEKPAKPISTNVSSKPNPVVPGLLGLNAGQAIKGDVSAIPNFSLQNNPIGTDFTLTGVDEAATNFATGQGVTAGGLPFLPTAGVIAGTALAAKGLNDLRKGRTDNSNLGKASRAQTALSTFGFSELARPFLGGKGKDQLARDAVRKNLLKSGFVDDKYNVTLPDGSTYNIGVDGSKFGKASDVDFSKEGIGDVVGAINPLVEIITGGNDKLRSDFAGYLTNAAISSGDANTNVKALYEKAGIDKTSAVEAINAMAEGGSITPEEKAAYLNGLNSVFGGDAPVSSNTQSSSVDKKKKKKKKVKGKVSTNSAAPVFALTNTAESSKNSADDMAKALMNIYLQNQIPNKPNPLLENRLLRR